LRSYLNQIRALAGELGISPSDGAWVGALLGLPGVIPEPGETAFHLEEEWPLFERVLNEALTRLQAMRRQEGQAMAQEFLQLRETLASHLAEVRERAPLVATAYRDRLHERVKCSLAELDVQIDRSELIKEVAIFAERSDIAEEVVRLASHLDQFREILNERESPGRKLEFLTQEMFREANTIGAKAGDVEISRRVVDIKGILEKVRELVQNVE
jgi:uncharacterized protein (TIGR00255 family)